MKKLLSVILAAALLLSLVPMAAAAGPGVSEAETPALVIGGSEISGGKGFLRNFTYLTQRDLDDIAASASGETTYRLGLGDCFTELTTYSTFDDHSEPTWAYRRIYGLDIRAMAEALGVDTSSPLNVFAASSDGSSYTLTDAFGVNTKRYAFTVTGEIDREVMPILALFQTTKKSNDSGHPGSTASLPSVPGLGADSPDRIAPLFGFGQTAADEINSCHWVKYTSRLRIGSEDTALTVTGADGKEKACSISSVVQMGVWRADAAAEGGAVSLTGLPLRTLLDKLGFENASSVTAVSADGTETQMRDINGVFAAWAAVKNGSGVKNATAIRLYDLETGDAIGDVTGLRCAESLPRFTDLENYDWAAEAVGFLADAGIVNGVGGGRFAPASRIKRGDFILMLCRAYGLSGEGGEGFPDVPADAYYHDAVVSAQAKGIARGSGGLFRPEDPVTRQEAMALLYRTLSYTGHRLPSSGDLSGFTDADSVSDWALEPVSALVGAGIINGSGGRLNPGNSMTRAEMAAALYRALTSAVRIVSNAHGSSL